MARFSSLVIVVLAAVVGSGIGYGVVGFGRTSRLPSPSGPNRVGTAIVSLPHSVRAGDAFVVQVWYPTDASKGPRAAYARGVSLPFPNRVLRAFVRTEAVEGAPVRAGRWPIVLYIPGLGGNRATNTALSQELASDGFVVVAANDTRPNREQFDYATFAATKRSVELAETKLKLQTGDVARIVDALERLDRRGMRFFRRLDFSRIGILGFSFGGAVAAEAAATDPRIRAAVNLDGVMYGRSLSRGVASPFMVMSGAAASDGRRSEDEDTSQSAWSTFERANDASIAAGLARCGGFAVDIAGAGHLNFTDGALLPGIRHRGSGNIKPERAYRIVARHVREFFERYLNGFGSPIASNDRDIPGAVTTVRVYRPSKERARCATPRRLLVTKLVGRG